MSVDIEVASSAPDERIEAMQQAWLDRCPIYLAAVRPNDVGITFTRGS
jgi:hypothetical protein